MYKRYQSNVLKTIEFLVGPKKEGRVEPWNV